MPFAKSLQSGAGSPGRRPKLASYDWQCRREMKALGCSCKVLEKVAGLLKKVDATVIGGGRVGGIQLTS